MAYVLLFAGHDPDLLARWENLFFAAGLEVVSVTDPAETVHKILGRAAELVRLCRSMPENGDSLGLVMRLSNPGSPIMMIADKEGICYLDPEQWLAGIFEEIAAAVRRSRSA